MVGKPQFSPKMRELADRWDMLRNVELMEEQACSPQQEQAALKNLQHYWKMKHPVRTLIPA